MAIITYNDKTNFRTDPSVAEVNKVTDDNMNEIKQVVNENAQKHIITAKARTDGTYTTTQESVKDMVEELRIGDKLTIDTSDYTILVGAGVSKIKIGGQMYVKNNSTSEMSVNVYITRKRGSATDNLYNGRSIVGTTGSGYHTISASEKIIEVQEGDKFQIGWYKTTTGSLTIYGNQNTFLTAEVVE